MLPSYLVDVRDHVVFFAILHPTVEHLTLLHVDMKSEAEHSGIPALSFIFQTFQSVSEGPCQKTKLVRLAAITIPVQHGTQR